MLDLTLGGLRVVVVTLIGMAVVAVMGGLGGGRPVAVLNSSGKFEIKPPISLLPIWKNNMVNKFNSQINVTLWDEG